MVQYYCHGETVSTQARAACGWVLRGDSVWRSTANALTSWPISVSPWGHIGKFEIANKILWIHINMCGRKTYILHSLHLDTLKGEKLGRESSLRQKLSSLIAKPREFWILDSDFDSRKFFIQISVGRIFSGPRADAWWALQSPSLSVCLSICT